MDYKDYYSLLGVSKDADQETIRKKYRRLARKHHPDVNRNSGADRKFKDLGEAYEVLKDPKKREAYDQYGANWKDGQQQQQQRQQSQQSGGFGYGSAGGQGFEGGFSDAGQYSDFFESLFGGASRAHRGGRSRPQRRANDVDASISIPLEDAYHGGTRTITFETPVLSPRGEVENKKKTLNLRIPKGIKKGGKIRLKGQGMPGSHGEPASDMYIKIDIERHALFDVEGSDVYLKLPIAPWEAALGAKVNVPTPGGAIKVNIPKGAESGQKLRLKGRGIPSKKAGDLYVELHVVLPPADDDQTLKVYKDMQALKFDPRKGLGV
jgi:curved DNA-binding protein